MASGVARWWQWAYAQPKPVNPVADSTGKHCALGQSGTVWFLAGTFFDPKEPGPAVMRDCTIPAGKALFFPVLNSIWVTYTADECQEHQCITEILNSLMVCTLAGQGQGCDYPGTTLEVKVDGMQADLQIENQVDSPYRVVSPDFEAVLPPDNIADVLPGDCPAQDSNLVCSPSVTDGIYVMLAPLSRRAYDPDQGRRIF